MTLEVEVETTAEAAGDVVLSGRFRFVALHDGHALLLEDDLLLLRPPLQAASSAAHLPTRAAPAPILSLDAGAAEPAPTPPGVPGRLLKRLADKVFGYFTAHYLQPEFDVLRAAQMRLESQLAAPLASAPAPAAPSAGGPLVLELPPDALSLVLGAREVVTTLVRNTGPSAFNVSVRAEEPVGFGLLAEALTPMPFNLAAGEQHPVEWLITAQRPSEVNLSQPWPLAFQILHGGDPVGAACLHVNVTDPRPGRLFYLLTEDCETFDGGPRTGDYHALPAMLEMHNRNNFMDLEEYRWQMIEKPAALNRIADKHGAKWTHFWCTSQRFAAEWAAGQSATRQWPLMVRQLDESIRQGCARHEYAPHVHFGFEPDSALPPQPRLLYDAATDGLIPNEFYHPVTNPNHRYHGWDGGRKGFAYVRELGDHAHGDTKVGSLFKAVSYLATLQRGHRLPLSAQRRLRLRSAR